MNSGQIYIVYVFLLSLGWFFFNKSSKFYTIASGFFVGVTISLRPSFLLFFIPVLICQRYFFLLGCLFGLLYSLSLSYAVAGIFIWKRYLLAMFGMTGFIDLNTYFPLKARQPIDQVIVYPKTIEGFDPTVRNPLEDYLDNTALYDVLNAIGLPNKREILVICFIVTFIFLCGYFLKYVFKTNDTNSIFLFGALICLIGDFFIPVGRYSYYDIQSILPLLILISHSNVKELIYNRLIAFLLTGFLLSIGCFYWIPRALFFSTFLIVFYITIASLIFIKRVSIEKKDALDL